MLNLDVLGPRVVPSIINKNMFLILFLRNRNVVIYCVKGSTMLPSGISLVTLSLALHYFDIFHTALFCRLRYLSNLKPLVIHARFAQNWFENSVHSKIRGSKLHS